MEGLGQQMQVGIECVNTLAPIIIVEEQVQVGVDVEGTFVVNVNIIQAKLQKIISMIKEQKYVAPNSMPNGHIVVNGEIDVGFILYFTCCNLLAHPSYLLEKEGGWVFLVKNLNAIHALFEGFFHIPFCLLNLCPTFLFDVKVGGVCFLKKCKYPKGFQVLIVFYGVSLTS